MSGQRETTQPVALSPTQLRSVLDQAFLTDAELDAFCIDYVPRIHRQFGAGMERTRKLNLLLSGMAAADLLHALRQHVPDVVDQVITQPVPAIPPLSKRRNLRLRWRAVVVLSALLLAVFLIRFQPLALLKFGDMRVPQRLLFSGMDEVGEPPVSPVLTTEPTEALVYEVPSGKLLGKTPWTPAPSFHGTEVCVRSPGFLPALVKLGPRSEPSWFRSVRVRLQQPSRAGPQRDSSEETCHVPTPPPE